MLPTAAQRRGWALQLLSGAAIVRDDPRDAVIRAVLDAVNRPVSWLGAR